uniref:Uncharacterized protein n=1 Tax=Lepeophtheirus salmonis TaxID=72036 RepID=A0A0K2VC93_LEPSM
MLFIVTMKTQLTSLKGCIIIKLNDILTAIKKSSYPL